VGERPYGIWKRAGAAPSSVNHLVRPVEYPPNSGGPGDTDRGASFDDGFYRRWDAVRGFIKQYRRVPPHVWVSTEWVGGS
jgi:hypothetical protein